MLKLIFNSPILTKVSNWDLKRAPDWLKLQKVHFNRGPSGVQLMWMHFTHCNMKLKSQNHLNQEIMQRIQIAQIWSLMIEDDELTGKS